MNDNTKNSARNKEQSLTTNPLSEQQFSHKTILTENVPEGNTKFNILCLEDVEVEAVKWLLYPYIPYGKITILQGDAGEGKTTLMLEIIARLSKGEPVYRNSQSCEPVNIIYQTCEDGLGDTIKPRLLRAGTDCSRIFSIADDKQPLSMTDCRIEQAIADKNARLLMLDPIQGFLGASVDMHRANEIRPVMKHLSNLAEKYNCAIVLVGHLNKCGFAKAAYRGLGSVDFQASARSVLLVGRLKNEPNVRVLCQSKSSLAPEANGLAFEIDPSTGFRWVGEVQLSSDDLLNGGTNAKVLKKDSAEELLLSLLRNGELPQTEIKAAAAKKNISERTLNRAKANLGVVSKKAGSQWYWSLK
ncbi:MAG: AAA family ATPase [Clostridiales bacterium]|nr:AAA family ATPase [Clostridiales bacterium]